MAISGTTLVLSIFSFIALGILARFFFSLADKYSIERTGNLFAGIGWLLIIIVLAPVFVYAVILFSHMWFGGEYLLNTLSLKTIGLTIVGLIFLWKVRTIIKDFLRGPGQ